MTSIDSKTTYTESQHPFGGDIWYINDTDLAAIDGGYSLIKKFIDLHPHKRWTLSLFNELSSVSTEIDCSVEDMPKVASEVYVSEHGKPITFIGENSLSKSYVIGFSFNRETIFNPGFYKFKDGQLVSL